MKYFEVFVKSALECTPRGIFRYAKSGHGRKKFRKRADSISKDISQLIDFVKENPKPTCR